jgi:hypothetical protein
VDAVKGKLLPYLILDFQYLPGKPCADGNSLKAKGIGGRDVGGRWDLCTGVGGRISSIYLINPVLMATARRA